MLPRAIQEDAPPSLLLPASVSIRQHTAAYVSIRLRCIRMLPRAIQEDAPPSLLVPACVSIRLHTSAYVSMRQHTSVYVSIRQHTSEYVSIRLHTSAYVSGFCEPFDQPSSITSLTCSFSKSHCFRKAQGLARSKEEGRAPASVWCSSIRQHTSAYVE